MASHVTSFSSHGESLAASGVKAFVVGPGHAPIPAKLVKKITSGEFVELADLLSTNLRAVDLEPQSFLDGKLLVSRKRRLVEVEDILTWTEAFTIYQMVICASHPHRWSDLTKYKLLIIQTARHAPGRSWLEYDTAFRKDAAATGASDWSRMNLDLYNFHLRSSVPPLLYHRPLARPHRSPRLEVAAPIPRTVILGTEVSAFGRLEIAASAIRATHVTVTTLGSAVHSIPPAPSVPVPPPPPREGGPERVLMPSTFPVHIADAVQWMLTSHHGVDFLRHYLDDFLTMGPPASPVCYNNLQACIQLCSKLGLPLHPDKLEGPSTCLSILGIELDTIRL